MTLHFLAEGRLSMLWFQPRSGIVTECNAYNVGMSVVRLGGGRVREQDAIDPGVGVWVEKKIGETIEGRTFVSCHSSRKRI